MKSVARPLLRMAGDRGDPVELLVDGTILPCFPSDTIATALLAVREHVATARGRRRGLYCGMGQCYECVAEIDGVPGTRTCMMRVRNGMQVRTSSWESPVEE